MGHEPIRLDRRRFVAGSCALPVLHGLCPPAGGAFAGGGARLRVGVVGCGGRGTGAALHAVAAATGVTITSMADAFADQLASSAAVLEARAGAAFDCPPERRFVGLDAWRQLLQSDVDLVILATPPAFRPAHAVAAVRAGKHVWCEKPGAVDADGARALESACAAAHMRGLSFASGLALRHDEPTAALVGRIRDGIAGRPLSVAVHGDLGLPWVRPARPEWTAAECALRNWISHDRYSGGHFVEHHVVAIDKALWVMGDIDPVAAVPDARTGGVRYLLPDGGHIEATLRRGPRAACLTSERVRCAGGMRDIRRPATAPHGERHPLRVAMSDLVAAILSGGRLDHGPWLCRATWTAIAGRMALESGTAVSWKGAFLNPSSPARPVQSVQS